VFANFQLVDGFRVDTVKHVQMNFWRPFNDAGGVYMVGEVLDGDPAYTCPYQNVMDGVLNYLTYATTTSVLTRTGLTLHKKATSH
jgi:glycosidase